MEEIESVTLKGKSIQIGHNTYFASEITVELYHRLIALAPSFEKQFEVVYKKVKKGKQDTSIEVIN